MIARLHAAAGARRSKPWRAALPSSRRSGENGHEMTQRCTFDMTATEQPRHLLELRLDNWPLALLWRVVISIVGDRALAAQGVLLGFACRRAARRGFGGLQCLGPLQGRPAGRAGHRASLRHEHLSAAVVAGLVVFRLSRQPHEPAGFVGLDNYEKILTDPDRLGAPASTPPSSPSSPSSCR